MTRRAAGRSEARRRGAPKRPNASQWVRFVRFLRVVSTHTPLIQMLLLLIVLWMIFAGALYLAERGAEGSTITSYGRALYWGIAAFSTAGIADTPRAGIAQIVGGIWIVLGSLLFFGTIVATITAYFMRPLQRPARRIVDTIEYNLEHLEDLSVEELDLLKETTETLIDHMERSKAHQRDVSD